MLYRKIYNNINYLKILVKNIVMLSHSWCQPLINISMIRYTLQLLITNNIKWGK